MSEPNAGRRKSILAATVGNFVEFYDWTIYALMAPIFASQIFYSSNPRISLLLAFSTFALGYIARPMGSLLFGVYSDRWGRRNAMSIAIVGMAICSLIIGLTPTYDEIGVFAPVIMITARLFQGISAGGEAGSATTYLLEFARPAHRAFSTSLHQISAGLSTLCALGTSILLSITLEPDALADWGWRVPFFIGAGLGVVGVYLRLRADETPIFKARKHAVREPVLSSLLKEWRSVLLTSAITLLPNIAFFSWQIYLPTYISKTTLIPHEDALIIVVIGILCFLVLILPSAMLSDRIGRKPMMLAYSVGVLVWAYPTYVGLPAFGDSFAYALFVTIVGNIILAIMAGSLVACMTEQFSTGVRATGTGLSYALGVVISGTTYPPIVTALMGQERYFLITIYVMVMAVIGLTAHIIMPETRQKVL